MRINCGLICMKHTKENGSKIIIKIKNKERTEGKRREEREEITALDTQSQIVNLSAATRTMHECTSFSTRFGYNSILFEPPM